MNHILAKVSRGEVRWSTVKEDFDIDELLNWTKSLSEKDLKAEIAIVDDEMDVTMYRLSIIEPEGKLSPATKDKHLNLVLNIFLVNSCGKMNSIGLME